MASRLPDAGGPNRARPAARFATLRPSGATATSAGTSTAWYTIPGATAQPTVGCSSAGCSPWCAARWPARVANWRQYFEEITIRSLVRCRLHAGRIGKRSVTHAEPAPVASGGRALPLDRHRRGVQRSGAADSLAGSGASRQAGRPASRPAGHRESRTVRSAIPRAGRRRPAASGARRRASDTARTVCLSAPARCRAAGLRWRPSERAWPARWPPCEWRWPTIEPSGAPPCAGKRRSSRAAGSSSACRAGRHTRRAAPGRRRCPWPGS